MNCTDRNALGRAGEDAAASYLAYMGWTIVARNVRRREGEVDIVARRAGTLAFVEVKTRRSAAFGTPAEAVTIRKQRRIRTLAAVLLAEGIGHARLVRFDVIDVRPCRCSPGCFTVDHIEDAF
ncbi:MAG TPA: YraN family protein [Actinomycetota bacterium]|nr:YraN family protein [Actinomycetota bacterium]